MSDDLARRRIVKRTHIPVEEPHRGWLKTMWLKGGDDARRMAWSFANQCALEDAGDGSLLYVSFRHHKIVHFPTLTADRLQARMAA